MKPSEIIRVYSNGEGEVTEYCPCCDRYFGASVKTDSAPTLSCTCPHCGKPNMLCSICPLRTQYHDGCDWSPSHPCSMADPVLSRFAWEKYWREEV